MFQRKQSIVMAGLIAASLVVSACGGKQEAPTTPAPQPSTGTPTAPAENKGPKILTLGIWSSPDSFHPITNKTTYGSLVFNLIYPRLLTMNDNLDFVPNLAEKWEMNATQDVFTFHLQKNAKWSDGKPITAHDVAYTFGVIAHPDTPTARRAQIDMIKGTDADGRSETKDTNISGIKVIDDHTIEMTLKGPVDKDAFLEKAATTNFAIMPKHVLETVTNLKELDKADQVMNPKVTGGAYKFVEYKTDSHIELAANDDFYLGRPKLDKLFIKIVTQATMAAAIEKGEIDVTAGQGIGEVPIADWERVSTLPNVTPKTYVAPSYQFLDFNIATPEFKDAKVRQAFAHAINRPLIVQRLLKGQGEVLNTPINSANKYYSKDLQSKLEFNTAKAKQMLTEAGWDFNKEITLLTPTGNLAREQSADIIQANLQDAGVKVKIEKVDFPTRQARSAEGKFQFSLVGFSATFDPDFSSQVMTTGGFNDRKYSNTKMDDIMVKGKAVVKFDEKKKVYDEAQALFADEVPFLPLYAVKALCVVNNRALNIAPAPQGIHWNAHLWDVK